MHEPPPRDGAVRLFYSYAHEDEGLKDRLRAHLSSLRRQGFIVEWHDRLIPPGREFDAEILEQLAAAQIVLLLVSPDFINSDYIYERELRLAAEKHVAGRAVVIPVVLRRCDWTDVPVYDEEGRLLLRLGYLAALPTDARPVTNWDDPEEALYDVEQGVKRAVLELLPALFPDDEPPAAPPPIPPGVRSSVYQVTVAMEEGPRPSLLKAMLAHLRVLARDAHLTLLELRRGSLVLVLRGTEAGMFRLFGQSLTGKPPGLFGHEILDVAQLPRDDAAVEGQDEAVEDDASTRAWTLRMEGHAAEERGDFLGALRLYERAIQLAEAVGDQFTLAMFMNDAGVLMKNAGLGRLALGYFQTAFNIFAELRIDGAASIMLANIVEARRLAPAGPPESADEAPAEHFLRFKTAAEAGATEAVAAEAGAAEAGTAEGVEDEAGPILEDRAGET